MAYYSDDNMKYIVLEMQTSNGTTATLVNSYSDLNQAKSKYHLVLSAAAISNVECHAAAILNQTGYELVSEFFEHPQEPEESEGDDEEPPIAGE